MGQKKGGCFSIIAILFIAVIAIAHWQIAFVAMAGVCIWALIKLITGKKRSKDALKREEKQISLPTVAPSTQHTTRKRNGDSFWNPKGNTIQIASYEIQDGMIYVGTGLGAPNSSGVDCALINPKLSVNKHQDDYTARGLNYWPSYTEASPDARAAYLKWLSTGKLDPVADIGYVFLYFYGLERRLLYDSNHSVAARDEKEIIIAEINRLLGIYSTNYSFNSYATSLLSYIQIAECRDTALYKKPAPAFSNHTGFTATLRIGLGQMVQNGMRIPADWALAWYCSAPSPPVYLRTAANRCKDEFKTLFAEEYARDFGGGLLIAKNKTKISVTYRPASKSLIGPNPYITNLDIPDVTTLTSPIKKMAPIIEKTLGTLDSYSRYLGRNPDKMGTMDALLELPSSLWPEPVRSSLEQLRCQITSSGIPLTMKFADLAALLPEWKDKSRKRMRLFYEVLGSNNLGIVPDTRFGDPLPEQDSSVVLFALGGNPALAADPYYTMAALTLYLAMLVSQADGMVSNEEIALLSDKLELWLFIKPTEKSRLQAYLTWLKLQDLKLLGIKKRLEIITDGQKEQIADILVQVSQADQVTTVQEIKLLERIFQLLGIEKTVLYSKIHAAATEPVCVYSPVVEDTGFAIPPAAAAKTIGSVSLDMTKVATLQADTERVTSILNAIFAQQDAEAELPQDTIADDRDEDHSQTNICAGLWGLPQDLSDFVRVLSEKPSWDRDELDELAEDRGFMLEGVLEQINETAFDQFDSPYTEDGPNSTIDINQEIAAVIRQ